MTIKNIANKISLSAPAVSNRIDKMEREGYIQSYHAIIDTSRLGYESKAFVRVEVRAALEEKFFKMINEKKNVVSCNAISGEYTMLLEVMFRTTKELDDFLGELQGYGKTLTNIVFSTYIEHRGIELEPKKVF
ncbi:transcriptional regulator, AsnC family [Lachnospiraceae bacterium KM106-2]|nr:transcriptional regulator, AsnC family [Lachnospiraceae bacterium KM106-2]